VLASFTKSTTNFVQNPLREYSPESVEYSGYSAVMEPQPETTIPQPSVGLQRTETIEEVMDRLRTSAGQSSLTTGASSNGGI